MFLRNELVQALMEVRDPEPVRTTNVKVVLIWYQLLYRFSVVLESENIYEIFERCIEKHRGDFPWLPNSLQNGSNAYLFLDFEDAILDQSFREADRATRALLGTYIDFLIQSVGETLTVNLICNIASRKLIS